MKRIGVLAVLLLMVGCGPNAEPATAEPTEAPTEVPTEVSDPEPTPTPEPQGYLPEWALVITGPEELVYDWSSMRCEEENIPDIAPRAWRDAEGLAHLTIGHLNTYAMVGPDLDHLQSDCSGPIFTSDLDTDPAMFNEGEWIGSVYTEDGQTVYAIVHSEYRGHVVALTVPGQCPSSDYLTCLDTALTLGISTDGGRTFQDAGEPPNHMIATMPYTFNPEGMATGLRQPSNIIKGPDGYYYVFSNIADYAPQFDPFNTQRPCVMRTDNLADPKSWRYWDGEGFNGVFLNPYVDEIPSNDRICNNVDPTDLAPGLVEGLIYSTELNKYIVIGISDDPVLREPYFGVFYSFSDDLLDWSPRQSLITLPVGASVADNTNDLYYAYPTLMDPSSASLTFDTTDGTMYLYISRFNAGGNSLDRDVVRWPVSLVPKRWEAPMWSFDTDGDAEGWTDEFDVEGLTVAGGMLSMQSVGDDPILNSPPFEFPASEYGRLSISMSVSPGEPTVGQIFFLTNTDTRVDEAKSILFDVISDGEFHTYDLDMSALDSWKDIIRWMRFDPVTIPGSSVDIDQIEFGN